MKGTHPFKVNGIPAYRAIFSTLRDTNVNACSVLVSPASLLVLLQGWSLCVRPC
jgi:hypothetical protein